MKNLHKIALVLLIVGGLNWGLVGLFNFDLVAMLFGEMSGADALRRSRKYQTQGGEVVIYTEGVKG